MSFFGKDVLQAVDQALGPTPPPRAIPQLERMTIEPRQPRIINILTPTGQLAVTRKVAERLLNEHVVTGELDGVVKATDANTVKAAMIKDSGICDFCSSPGVVHVFEAPDFELVPGNTSVGGWAACEECTILISADKRKALLERAMEHHAFPKFSRTAIDDLFKKFWRGLEQYNGASVVATAIGDFINEKHIPVVAASADSRESRIASASRITGLSQPQIHYLLDHGLYDNDAMAKLIKCYQTYQSHPDKHNPAQLQRMIEQLAGIAKPLPNIVPHWQMALDMQYDALKLVCMPLLRTGDNTVVFPDATDLNDPKQISHIIKRAQQITTLRSMRFDEDEKLLRRAEAYSFNAETVAAIEQAAATIPHDAPLSSIETPNTGSGWFWFAEPMDIASSPEASPVTNGLLWGWQDFGGMPAIRFSTYVIDQHSHDPKMHGHCLPATRWYWPLNMTFHEMIGLTTMQYEKSYGPGGAFHGEPDLMGQKLTLEVVARFSLFFLMSCVWFQQRVPVLVKEAGHVERHARKRLQREHKLDDAPKVQVIALRKSLRMPPSGVSHVEGEGTKREYHFRWVVSGHTRMQRCGPGFTDKKLIWIEPHPAGPDDKPLKVKTKVYAVIR